VCYWKRGCSMTIPLQIHKEPVWVLVDGELRNIAEFAHLKPAERPVAICPECRTQVTMKLGEVKIYHYAHMENVECKFLRYPESLLHYNTKIYFAKFLKTTNSLSIDTKCATKNCYGLVKQKLFMDWDDVRVEYSVGRYRADVALITNNQIIGVIEIFVTHLVEDEKAAFLTQNNIRWLEFQATEDFIESSETWNPNLALPYVRYDPPLEPQICPNCEQKAFIVEMKRLEEERAKQREYEAQQEALRNKSYFSAVMIVDFYPYHSEERQRHRYMLQRQLRDNVWIEARIVQVDERTKTLFVETSISITANQLKNLNQKLQKYLNSFQKKIDGFYDIVLAWKEINEKSSVAAHSFDMDYPSNYYWHSDYNKWEDKRDDLPF
jgi:hypothetical protein